MPDAIPYKLAKTRTGKIRVKYACPHCSDVLENELTEAGQRDTCPACAKQFIVPGEAKRKEVEADLQRRADNDRAESEARQAAKEKAAEQKSLKALEYQKIRIEEQRIKKHADLSRERDAAMQSERTRYPWLEFYGHSCVVIGVISICIAGLVFVGFLLTIANENTINAASAIQLTVAISSVATGFVFLIASELIQLILDARRDIAKLVNQERFRDPKER